MIFRKALLPFLLFVLLLPTAHAVEIPTFEHDVRPILKAQCFHCHGEGEKLKGDVDLRLRRFMAEKVNADGLPLLTPGEPEKSLILSLIRSGEMPKGDHKLKAAEVSLIESWIAAGAPTVKQEPTSLPKGFVITEEERAFWSFQKVVRPPIPATFDSARSPVDPFIIERLNENGLTFAPRADRPTLIRRLFEDLLGLPPSPEDVQAFIDDPTANADERWADRLLASPHYGERWGRHWLDVAGYADSNGYAESDSERPQAWRYRDYVIQSFNEGKPWNEFITEQLAGDELLGATQENAAEIARDPQKRDCLAATGFLLMAPDGTGDGVDDQNLARNQTIAETLRIVSSSLLGLTVACAQCHDHRYDPISQADYYSWRAIFEPGLDWKNWRTPNARLVSLYSDEDRAKAEAIEAEARKIDEAANQLRKQLLDEVFEREVLRLPENLRQDARIARATPQDKRTDAQRALFKEYPAADVQGALDLYDVEANKKVLAKQGEASALRGTKPAEPMLGPFTERAAEPPKTHVFYRGDHEEPREEVTPAELTVLNAPQISIPTKDASLASSGRRLAYARWLTSGEHPLVARVLVNRFWMHHFGKALVSTPGDFGKLGESPTHPALLAWLAAEFVSKEWNLKPLHRLLVTSAVYQQSARSPASLESDPENRFYGRWKLRRLEAEAVRDAILSVSGALDESAFGPPVPIAQDDVGRVVTGAQGRDGRGDPTIVNAIGADAYRRSVYVQVRRSLPLTVLDAFDAPVMTPNCEARQISVAPAQALTMLNDAFLEEQSLLFAKRLQRERPSDNTARITRAWELAFGAAPTENETDDALRYLSTQTPLLQERLGENPPQDAETLALASLCQGLLGSNRFLFHH